MLLLADGGTQLLARTIHIKRSVLVERDHVGGIHERKPKVFGHHARGEVLAAADDVLRREIAALGAFAEHAELVTDRVLEVEFLRDLAKTLPYGSQQD